MEWWIALIVVAALGIAAAAAVGGMGEMTKDPVRDVYRQDLPARPLGAVDLDGIRFGITLRGYAMGQVDDLLDRVSTELAERDALIAEITGGDPVAELERRRQRSTEPPAVGPSGWGPVGDGPGHDQPGHDQNGHDQPGADRAGAVLGSDELVPADLGSADLVPDDPMPGDRAGAQSSVEGDRTSAVDDAWPPR